MYWKKYHYGNQYFKRYPALHLLIMWPRRWCHCSVWQQGLSCSFQPAPSSSTGSLPQRPSSVWQQKQGVDAPPITGVSVQLVLHDKRLISAPRRFRPADLWALRLLKRGFNIRTKPTMFLLHHPDALRQRGRTTGPLSREHWFPTCGSGPHSG